MSSGEKIMLKYLGVEVNARQVETWDQLQSDIELCSYFSNVFIINIIEC